ncbi:reverse transcriptase domain-containing protein [Micromonospora rifamycinica]|uniref:reverse transcriptase domain-containing protein n=1 Tax=Micromonospora rifamycinica TaxID=291594 RepID=UPI0033D92A01
MVRYADDFLVLVHGNQEHVEDLRDQVSTVLATMGLRLSDSKTRIAHLADRVDFLGFRVVWQRKRGTSKRHVYTFIADEGEHDDGEAVDRRGHGQSPTPCCRGRR